MVSIFSGMAKMAGFKISTSIELTFRVVLQEMNPKITTIIKQPDEILVVLIVYALFIQNFNFLSSLCQ